MWIRKGLAEKVRVGQRPEEVRSPEDIWRESIAGRGNRS
jgi:hypothetical protein